MESRSGGTPPGARWQRRWAAVSPGRRHAVAVGAALAVALPASVAGVERAGDWLTERKASQEVRLTTSLGIFTSSSTPRGGYVSYYVELHNDGVAPLQVTSVRATADRLRLDNRSSGSRELAAGGDIIVPLSVLLTCAPGEDAGSGGELETVVEVVREDGTSVQRRPRLRRPQLVLDVATTLCSVRPGLRDHELSGPIIRAAPATGEG